MRGLCLLIFCRTIRKLRKFRKTRKTRKTRKLQKLRKVSKAIFSALFANDCVIFLLNIVQIFYSYIIINNIFVCLKRY